MWLGRILPFCPMVIAINEHCGSCSWWCQAVDPANNSFIRWVLILSRICIGESNWSCQLMCVCVADRQHLRSILTHSSCLTKSGIREKFHVTWISVHHVGLSVIPNSSLQHSDYLKVITHANLHLLSYPCFIIPMWSNCSSQLTGFGVLECWNQQDVPRGHSVWMMKIWRRMKCR